MERQGTDLRKLLPQAAKSPAHRRHQKDRLRLFSTAHSWEEEELSKNSLRRQTLPLNSKFEPKQKQEILRPHVGHKRGELCPPHLRD